MEDAGVHEGDILVIDKSLEPSDGKMAVCFIDGEFTLKTIFMKDNAILLVPANPQYPTIRVTEDNDFQIWGIVTYIIKRV
jgi:DNA polymerase V